MFLSRLPASLPELLRSSLPFSSYQSPNLDIYPPTGLNLLLSLPNNYYYLSLALTCINPLSNCEDLAKLSLPLPRPVEGPAGPVLHLGGWETQIEG